MGEDLGMSVGMGGEIVVGAIGPRIHQFAEPLRAGSVITLQDFGIDEEALAEVLPDGGLSFGFGGAAQSGEVIHFDAVEVVLALGVDHAEDGIAVGMAVDVSDAPIVTDDGDASRFSFLAGEIAGRLSGKNDWSGKAENAESGKTKQRKPPGAKRAAPLPFNNLAPGRQRRVEIW